jgi:uncharacterized membrane protein YfcA
VGIVSNFHFSSIQWAALLAAAFILGFSKTGINGIFMLSVTIIASSFGAKESTGMLAPMLLVGDVIAVVYYSRHADWKIILQILPWLIAGLMIGMIVGKYIDSRHFKYLIAISVLVCLVIMTISEIKGGTLKVPERLWFYGLTGIVTGFTTMVGNAGGPVLTLYLIAKGYKKNDNLGTITWMFFISNLLKLPLQVFFWHNIDLRTLQLSVLMIPAILVGALIGVHVIKVINEKPFRILLIAATAVTAIRLMF